MYLGNLAVADLLMVTCLPFWAVTLANNFEWVFGAALCKAVNAAIFMNYVCSVLFLVLVSVDRYLALAMPMRPSCLRRAPWAKRLCLAVWLLGLLLSLPGLLFRSVSPVPEAGVEAACFLSYPHPSWRVQHNVTVNVVGFLVPLPIVAFCTHHVLRALRDSRMGVAGAVGRAAAAPGIRNERKATQLVLAVLVVFVVCWMPYQLLRLLDTVTYLTALKSCNWSNFMDVGEQLVTYLAYSNSVINPFLYVIVGKHFRRKARGVFKQLRLFRSKDGASVSSVSRDTQKISIQRLDKRLII